MVSQRRSPPALWSSGAIFILAVTGSAVGLGNVWKFPYMVSANGGGAFFLLYLCCLAVIGFPLLVAEVLIGRRGRRSPITSYGAVATEEGRLGLWQAAGWLAAVAALLLLASYSVVGGWAMAYVFRAAGGIFADLDALQAAEAFQQFIADPERLLGWHTIFMAVIVMIVSRGVRWGLEEAVRWFMPMLLGLLVLLAGYTAAATGHFDQALTILFRPDFSKLATLSGFWHVLTLAMGHAFYTLSLAVGAVAMYGAYLGNDVSILRACGWIIVIDTIISVLAGLVVFPVVFANDLLPTSGPTLIFQTLPLAFGQMPNGTWFGTLFFLLLTFAAWTSAMALLEPAVAFLTERGMERGLAAAYVGVVVWALGVVALLSFNVWEHVRPLPGSAFRNSTLFDSFNFLAANVLLPLVGLLAAIFAGWRISRASSELELGGGLGYRVWRVLIRYVTPVAVIIVFVSAIGIEF